MSKKTGPIKPKDVLFEKSESIPSEVFEVFNDLIKDHWDGSLAVVRQTKAVERIAKALDISTDEVFDRGYLDVEHAYRKAGWKVKYDKPGYCETYEAYFRFTK
jgi:hypothetical protein